ncbi:hypothetical protein CPB83DRAFT_279441 [Crepidotus variabilis]|uniref:Uncharacterized protein n=1 Tax=Crepidotus variabilis TaxID=179855 RepID=A0A9P6BD96_9AGAR|nr:hypothetical protein CPB83DRAFT_279441 [Crepidotus variabilis]
MNDSNPAKLSDNTDTSVQTPLGNGPTRTPSSIGSLGAAYATISKNTVIQHNSANTASSTGSTVSDSNAPASQQRSPSRAADAGALIIAAMAQQNTVSPSTVLSETDAGSVSRQPSPSQPAATGALVPVTTAQPNTQGVTLNEFQQTAQDNIPLSPNEHESVNGSRGSQFGNSVSKETQALKQNLTPQIGAASLTGSLDQIATPQTGGAPSMRQPAYAAQDSGNIQGLATEGFPPDAMLETSMASSGLM